MLYCGSNSKIFVMTIRAAQDQVDDWINTTGVRYFSELTNMTILTEEVGELARHMARQYGDQSYKKDELTPSPSGFPSETKGTGEALGERSELLADEMADIFWVLLCLANQTGVDLTAALEKNFEKKTQRDAGTA